MRYLKKLSENLLGTICVVCIALTLSFYFASPVWAAPSGIQKKANRPATPYTKSVIQVGLQQVYLLV